MTSKKFIFPLVTVFIFTVSPTVSLFAKSLMVLPNEGVFKNLPDTVPVPDSSTDGRIFEKVDEEAFFPGGEETWRSYLGQNLNPSVPVDKGAPAGLYTVYIQFVVGIDGKIYDIKPLTKHGYGMEGEVIRILRKSPPWAPAVQNGQPVNAYRKQPVTFQVIEEKKKKRNKG